MPKRVISSSNGIHVGARLAKRRQEAGYSQRDLAAEVGISQRMIAYYETQAEPPPSYVLPRLAKALNASVDELIGVKPMKQKKSRPQRSRLLNRVRQIESLSPQDYRQVVQFIDTVVERARLKGQKA